MTPCRLYTGAASIVLEVLLQLASDLSSWVGMWPYPSFVVSVSAMLQYVTIILSSPTLTISASPKTVKLKNDSQCLSIFSCCFIAVHLFRYFNLNENPMLEGKSDLKTVPTARLQKTSLFKFFLLYILLFIVRSRQALFEKVLLLLFFL